MRTYMPLYYRAAALCWTLRRMPKLAFRDDEHISMFYESATSAFRFISSLPRIYDNIISSRRRFTADGYGGPHFIYFLLRAISFTFYTRYSFDIAPMLRRLKSMTLFRAFACK